MAVYTDVTAEELNVLLERYDIGVLRAFKGIAEGVENTNFYLSTDRGQFILTLYEKRVRTDELPFFIGLMSHLSENGVICPIPVADKSGSILHDIAGKPAALITFLPGYSLRKPAAAHCFSLGCALATLHIAGQSFPLSRVNGLSLSGWTELQKSIGSQADAVIPGLGAYLANEIEVLSGLWPEKLPAGVIHADLFPDNVFFLNDAVSGIIDFYFACNDLLSYDLAICMNAWCFETDHAFNVTKARAFFRGYSSVRPLRPEEIAAMPVLARGAALRFLLTRTHDWFNTPETALVRRKDPVEYWRKLRFHATVASPSAYGF